MLSNEIEQKNFSIHNKDAAIEQLKSQNEEILNEIKKKKMNLIYSNKINKMKFLNIMNN